MNETQDMAAIQARFGPPVDGPRPQGLDSPLLAAHVAEVDAVFGRGWVCVGHIAMVPSVGDYFTLDLIGNPLVVVRASDQIRVLSRVCLHRWASVVEGRGRTRLFTCPFHAWAYALDGSLVAAPFMEGAEGFEASDCKLPEARTEVMEETGLIFANLSQTSAETVDPPMAFFEAGLSEAVAAGPYVDELKSSDWKRVIVEAQAATPGAHALLPNVLLKIDGGAARIICVFPNGPDSALLRRIDLLGATGEAVTSGPAPANVMEFVEGRLRAEGA